MHFPGFRTLARVAPLAFLAFGPACFAQNWAVGVDGGFGVFHDATIKNAAGASADAGFESRYAVGAVLTEDIAEHIAENCGTPIARAIRSLAPTGAR